MTQKNEISMYKILNFANITGENIHRNFDKS